MGSLRRGAAVYSPGQLTSNVDLFINAGFTSHFDTVNAPIGMGLKKRAPGWQCIYAWPVGNPQVIYAVVSNPWRGDFLAAANP